MGLCCFGGKGVLGLCCFGGKGVLGLCCFGGKGVLGLCCFGRERRFGALLFWAGYGFRRLLYYVGVFGIVLPMRIPPPPDERNARPMELALKTIFDRSPAPDPRRIIKKPSDRLARHDAIGLVLLPVEAGDPQDPFFDGEGSRGLRLWSRADSRACGSRAGRTRICLND